MDYFQRYIEERKKRKGKENTCSRYPPFFLRKFLSPLSKHLGYAAIYTSKPLSRARGKGEERRKKGGERKREFSRPSFAFYPPRSGSKSREPLSHRLLDACKYPWQRGTTMRGDPRRELFLRISGWSALPKISRRKREREEEAFGKNFLLIRDLFLPSPPYFLIHSLCLENLSPLEESCCATTLKRRKFTRSSLKLLFQISKEMVRSIATNCIVNYLNTGLMRSEIVFNSLRSVYQSFRKFKMEDFFLRFNFIQPTWIRNVDYLKIRKV